MKKKTRLTGILLLINLAIGLLFIWHAVDVTDSMLGADLSHNAQLVARAISNNVDRVQTLLDNPADFDNPGYLRLKEQLGSVRVAIPHCRLVHLLAPRSDGTYFCLVSSVETGAGNDLVPGQVYKEVSKEYHRAFDAGVTSIRGPYTGRQGTLARAVVPILDSYSGAVISVLSIDVDAEQWKWAIARATFLPILFTLILTGIILVLGVTRFGYGRWRHAEITTVIAVGFTITTVVTLLAYQDEVEHQRNSFYQLALSQTGRVSNIFSALESTELEALARFLEGKETVSKAEYDQFAGFLTKNPAVQAWEWVPAVSDGDRSRLEQEAQAAGMSEFTIWEKDQAGNPVAASERPFYYPVLFAAPVSGNERAYGYDLGSNSIRQAGLEEAWRTDLVTATDPVTLVQEKGHQQGLLVFHPVFKSVPSKTLRGFALAVLRMDDMLKVSIADTEESGAVLLDLFQLHGDNTRTFMASTWKAESKDGHFADLSVTVPVFAFGKTFALVATPSSAFDVPISALASWILVLTGLVFTLVSAQTIGSIVARRRELNRLVEERTAALKKESQRYELVLDGVSGGIIDWDLLEDKIHFSKGWNSMHGYDRADVIDASIDWVSTIHPEDRARMTAMMKDHFAGKTSIFQEEYRICCMDGSIKHVVGRGKAVRNDLGRVIRMAGSETDITEQKRIGESLERERERMENVIDGANIGTWEWNIQTGETIFNQRWGEILGYTVEETAGFSREVWEGLIHPDDLRLSNELQGAHFARVLDHFACEMRMRHRCDGWVWVAVHGKVNHWAADGGPLLMFGTQQEITARKRAEERLHENEANFNMFFNSMTDLVMACTPDGTLLFANSSFEHRLGYHSDELGNLNVLDVHPVECREEANQIFAAMLRGERESFPLPLVTKDGSHVPVETHIWFSKWDGRDCIFGMSKDLSEEQDAYQRFERLFRSNPALMAVSLSSDRSLTDVNDSFLFHTGYTRDEVIGKTTAELGLFADPDRHSKAVDVLKSTGHMSSVELDVICKNGTLLHGLISGELIRSQGRELILSVMIDITDRKRAEQMLRESEESYRNQFGANGTVMILIDPKDAAIVDVNDAAVRFYGYPRERFRAMRITDINTLPAAEVLRVINSVPKGEGKQWEFHHRLADGSVRDVEVSSCTIQFGGRLVVHSIVHDITERVRAQHALGQTAERLSLATRAGGVGIWEYYVDENRLVWDDQMFRLYGITDQQFSGAYDAWQAGLHPDDLARGDKEINLALSGEKEFDTEFRVMWPDGSVHSIRALAVVYRDSAGKAQRLIGTNWDITQRKEAEAEIRRQATMIRSLLDSIPDIIFFKDVNGVYLGCNPPFAEFVGRSQEDIVGKTDYDLFDRGTADSFRENDQSMLELREPRHNEEWITYSDGRRILIDTLKTPYWASDGSLVGVLGISRDITVRKQAEDSLRDLNATIALQVKGQVAENMALERALIHQSRLAGIGEMLNNIAHQWRQPLNALGIALANMQDAHKYNELDEALMDESMGTANRLIQRMSATINDFRTFFQPDKELVHFSLMEQISSAVTLVEPSLRSDQITIRLVGDDELLCYGISNQYSQVLLNMLMNASEAIVAHKPAKGLIEIELFERDGKACVSVTDNGGGIPQEVLERIFEPYFTTKPQGSGIGLYMSEMIISRRMNGSIEARNVADGAVITIITPLVPQTDKQRKQEAQ